MAQNKCSIQGPPVPDYVELHCHSNFSLLDGSSHQEEIAARAKEPGMPAITITDHEGLYGAAHFSRACEEVGVKPIVGAEVTLTTGHHAVLLARNNAGWSNLCRLVSAAQLSGQKGLARYTGAAGGRQPQSRRLHRRWSSTGLVWTTCACSRASS